MDLHMKMNGNESYLNWILCKLGSGGSVGFK